jgi:hypothetical protein
MPSHSERVRRNYDRAETTSHDSPPAESDEGVVEGMAPIGKDPPPPIPPVDDDDSNTVEGTRG